MVKTCYLCPLGKTRKNVVFGEGNPNARLMFIGEGPGSYEDQTGRPFVGRSGQLLTNIITNVLNLRREDVYIANIVKCRPPNNRVPNMDEANSCRAYLLKQIELVNPEIIVALGRVSYHHLTRDYDKKMHQVRGEIFDLGNAKLMPTFHPSFMLRNPSSKREVYKDMLRIKDMLS
ncbi:MAG: uracil-DNA glycosylase [Proteobacteria bacterium]|nr:MAG: uracil-DNA glycosylase [Pseudomonadota bacterium]